MKNLAPVSAQAHSNAFPWLPLFVGLLLLAFGLRVIGLGSRTLWFDESIEYWMAQRPLSELYLEVSNATHDPPLYSYLLHGWQLLGIQEFWLRLPALYASMLGIAGTAVLATRAFNRRTGLVAALLLMLAAADIRYAQEAGQYALMICLVAWNLLFLYLACRQDGRWRWWLLWGATAVLSVYTHYGTALVILASSMMALLQLAYRRRWAAVGKLVGVGVLAISFILPLVLIVVPRQIDRLGATPHPFGLREFALISARILVFQFLGNEAILRWPWEVAPNWLPAIPVLWAMLFAVRHKKWRMLPGWLAVTWLVYYLVGRTGTYFYDSTRHSMLLTPLIMVTVAAGLVTLWQRQRLAAGLLLLFIVVAALLIPRAAQEDLRTVVTVWRQQARPGDSTYVYYGAVPGFRYQLDVQTGSVSALPGSWYGDCWRPGNDPAFCRENGVYYGNWARSGTPEMLRASMLDTLGRWPERLWLVFAHIYQTEDAAFLAALDDVYRVAFHKSAVGADLYLLTRR